MIGNSFRIFAVFMTMFVFVHEIHSCMSKSERNELNKLCNTGWNLYHDTQEILEKNETNKLKEMEISIDANIAGIREIVDGYPSEKNKGVKDAKMLVLYLLTISSNIRNKMIEYGIM